MPLARMLSAVRELILDGPVPVGDVRARRAALAERFVDLSDAEIDDLAAIPPERLRVYTRLVFNGERSALRWAFPMSLASIHRLLDVPDDVEAVNRADFELVRDLHRQRPWHSASHRELAANFQSYILDDRSDLRRRWPGLADLVAYERTDVDVFYAADVAHAPADAEHLDSMTVGKLMELRVVRPPYAEVMSFDHDVPAVAAHWRLNKLLPDPLPDPASTLAAVGRDPYTLSPSWVRLTPAGAAALEHLEPGAVAVLNDAAGAYLAAQSPNADEIAQFRTFFAEFRGWLAAGVLLRAPN